ncbi:glyoxylate/hydroxypyruvate reductase A [Rhizobiaceae bacterium BDR2-2]|uniref:Glyoxylate/hydroxypyruvate reductase A n=1 Tax=Ectorhizobium quercum TaxID=2965071 RepID=A0AAE3ST79_9HYPH|nr:glyoxylate/hydroxypyruvate reductase A [Ectorhizobium quercum]MCX8995662.1 glyoxylate/hydroxypyruvate reductase A [Ectorhizobium quercum]
MNARSAIILDLKFARGELRETIQGFFPDREIVDLADPANAGRDLSGIAYAVVWKPDADLFRRAPDLELLFSGGAGVDHIMAVEGIPDIPIVRFVDRNLTTRMSEWVVLQCLIHLRRVLPYLEQQQKRIWSEFLQPEAAEVTVGLMGLGVLGLDAAAKLKALGFDVIGWSRTKKQIEGMETFDAAGMDDFLSRTDFLVGLLPLTPETTGLYDRALFSRLRQGGALKKPVFINAGRGGSQNEADLYAALADGTLGGASVDVFQVEPLPETSPLWGLGNLVITPHAAAPSEPAALFQLMQDQIGRYERGETLQFTIDRAAGY